jgi:hypothetical protein
MHIFFEFDSRSGQNGAKKLYWRASRRKILMERNQIHIYPNIPKIGLAQMGFSFQPEFQNDPFPRRNFFPFFIFSTLLFLVIDAKN